MFNSDYNINNLDEEVKLKGWVAKTRNLGGVIFIDLRDRSGIIQLVVRPDNDCYEVAKKIKNEYVIEAFGKIIKREKAKNNIKTGEIEVDVKNLNIL